jgi:hypothetical protein
MLDDPTTSPSYSDHSLARFTARPDRRSDSSIDRASTGREPVVSTITTPFSTRVDEMQIRSTTGC